MGVVYSKLRDKGDYGGSWTLEERGRGNASRVLGADGNAFLCIGSASAFLDT